MESLDLSSKRLAEVKLVLENGVSCSLGGKERFCFCPLKTDEAIHAS